MELSREPTQLTGGGFILDLVDGDRVIGWMAPDCIGFRGFADAREAGYAAWIAHRALAGRDQRRGGSALPVDDESLTLVRRDGDQFVAAAGQPIAKLLDPSKDPHRMSPPTHSFELKLGTPLDEMAVRALAHRVYRALRRSGTPWALFPSDGSTGAKRAPASSDDMHVGSPLPRWAAAVSVILVIVAIAVLWPVVGAGIAAIGGTFAFIVVWLVFRRRMPPNAMPRDVGTPEPGRRPHYHER